jgi:hypothetical protein
MIGANRDTPMAALLRGWEGIAPTLICENHRSDDPKSDRHRPL